jgi:hypothetical protein
VSIQRVHHHYEFAGAPPSKKSNKAIDPPPIPRDWPLPGQNRTKVEHNLFPIFIASNSQLQEGLKKIRRNAPPGDVRATPRFDHAEKR